MKQPLLVAVLAIFLPLHFFAQPFSLGTNNVKASLFRCVNLDDCGTYKQIILQANQSSSSTKWEFQQICSFLGEMWRRYGSRTPPAPFNAIVPAIPITGLTWYKSENGGASSRSNFCCTDLISTRETGQTI